ncbi:MAG: hypothetical protein AAB475_01500 [Patescibacteria group bacterium]
MTYDTDRLGKKVKLYTNKFTAIFSDDDPIIHYSDSEIFENKLNAKIITENKKTL